MRFLLFLALPCCIVARMMMISLCKEGQIRPWRNDDKHYWLCKGGNWERAACPPGWVFDHDINDCIQEEGEAEDYCDAPRSCHGPQYFEDRCDCHRFYECVGDEVKHKDCGVMVFNLTSVECELMKYNQLCEDLKQEY